MRFIYTLVFYIGLPFVFLRLFMRGKKAPDYRQAWAERLAYVPFRLQNCIWIHAVSFGESMAATPLIKYLLKQHPDMPILVTTTTPTGKALIKKNFGDQVYLSFFPYDLPTVLARFFRRVQPKILILIETELWPNLLKACKKRHIPVLLANARLSERSAAQYAKVSSMTAKMLQSISCIAAQNKEDGQRFVDLGLAPERLKVIGSIKFDISLPQEVLEKSPELKAMWQDRPVWIAASTHHGEEEQILEAFRLIQADLPNALLILVPRHPERFAPVKELCEKAGFTVVSRSSQLPCMQDTQIYLGDTMGELLILYGAAQVAFIGGSFASIGGHNLLEPAALGVPSIIGPHYFNFKEITTMLVAAEASYIIQNKEELATRVIELLKNPLFAKQRGENGLRVLEQNRGALAKLCGIIDSILA
ncbi:MAG: 3-deoxy-D-manno-octulosonic acid transferase [Gammaproteobacteria bacterium]|jgi:3-deoxy-D-manno-octulosonic-acid transferase|nr:3-deoxy-D-manno-octulosonic acid transferase [Gammaproteobacteria bacterium]